MNIRILLKKIQKKVFKKSTKPVYIPVLYGDLVRGKNILITGSASGIGLSIAEACIRNGAQVIITSRSKRKLQKAYNLLENKYPDYKKNIYLLKLDVQKFEDLNEKFEEAVSFMPDKKIDILINNAGVNIGNAFGKTDFETYDTVLETNLKGTYFLSQIFSNFLIENKLQGNILNILSSSSIRPANSPYMISKWGESGLTKGLAKSLIPHGIIVNAIAPGPTATEMLGKDGTDLYRENSPVKRYIDKEEIANLALFMISKMGNMIIGDTVYMTGGAGLITYDDIEY